MEGLLHSLGLNLKVLIVQVIAFAILIWVLGKFLFGRIGQFLQRREEEIKGSFQKIEERQKEVERLTADYERRLQEIEKERDRKIQEAVQEGLARRAAIEEQAKKEADRERARALEQIQIERDKAILMLRQESARIGVEIAEKVLAESVTPDVQKRVVDRYLKELDAVKRA
jgi:F-type H+-transporting ATPase subunit b